MTQTRMTTRLPTALAEALATRAEANHRSINGELCAILQAALSGTSAPEPKTFGERVVKSFIDAGIACPKCGNHPREHRPTCPMVLHK